MKKLCILLLVLFVATPAFAANLSWTAPSTYTDSTPIPGGKTIAYQAKSGSSSSGPWSNDGTSTTSLTKVVSEPTPGSTKWYSVSATVDGVESANATPVSKTAPFLTPNPPTGLQIN